MSTTAKRTKTKFYIEDVVYRLSNPQDYGIILRSWTDEDDLPLEGDDPNDPLLRRLQPGEFGVTFANPPGNREILPESELVLVDRTFQLGDLCKRNIDDLPSGVVVRVEPRGQLHHAITGAKVDGWRKMEDLQEPTDICSGDYIVYNDWVGQIVEMFDEAVVESEGGRLVRVPELSAHLMVGDQGKDILPSPSPVHSLINVVLPRPEADDIVVEVKHTVLAVSWLAINQSLDPAVAATRSRPKRFWFQESLSDLTLIRLRSDRIMRGGDRVRLKDESSVPITRHGEGDPNGPVEVKTLVVQDVRTDVDVLWQNGTIEKGIPSTELIPYLNPGDSDAWPGDYVLWKGEGSSRPAVVQSVNAADRTCTIRYTDDNTVELASLLELDAYGIDDLSGPMSSNHEGLGLRRGDLVLIHRDGTTNGADKFRVPKLGEIEAWAREPPEVENGQMLGWRKEMLDIGIDIAKQRMVYKDPEATVKRGTPGDPSLNWLGEVVDLRLDGTVELALPDGTSAIYPLERLTRLYDSLEQLEDLFDDMSEHSSDEEYEEDEIEIMDENGQWAHIDDNDDDEGDWEDDEDEQMEVEDSGIVRSKDVSPIPRPELADDAMDVDDDASVTEVLVTTDVSPASQAGPIPAAIGATDSVWARFEVLASAPPDHAFYSSVPGQPSRSFLGRLQKEYRALTSSLPDTILVRAYEDRTDLLRCLIIGPSGTPYEDAPFVIDWMLESDFPQTPPKAHFLSWTNGNGRVNPNLYEEGKVCLSILGTWSGEKTETWSTKSSLLQVLVSIQGLVLVKEPWFCEPAYEKLRGTEEGTVSSRLYSEKAYVLSRGFVRRALEIPLSGLETEIDWLYRRQGKLEKVIKDARTLIEKSKVKTELTAEEQDRAVPRLTAGGIIALERTLGLDSFRSLRCRKVLERRARARVKEERKLKVLTWHL